ncbi:MAG: hypothetical protein IJA82_03025 [Clostridia bacterium]|nr:hypothetical protein [Clostridia bacterium]
MAKNRNQNEQNQKTVNKGKVQDPPVPNRAHTDMKQEKNQAQNKKGNQ